MFRRIAFALAATSLLSACASMMDGKSQVINVDSNPKGAKIFVASKVTKGGQSQIVNRTEAGVTPAAVTVQRKDGVIILEADGYETTEVPLKRTLNNWMWGNILLTSPLSTSIDTSTGASNEFDPGQYMVEMQPKP